MKKLAALAFVLVLLLSFSSAVFAGYNGYEITSYDVTMDVGIDNVIRITERIDVFAEYSKHGIIRNIPKEVDLHRADGTSSSYRAIISNLSVSEKYSTDTDNGELAVKIGDEDRTFTGAHSYVISYDYKIGKYKSEGFDELYMNIIGTNWDTTIDNVTFTINMPAEFDPSLLGFTHGGYSSYAEDNIEYEVNGTTITGRYIGTLDSYEGLTVRAELPDEYFVIPELHFDVYTAFMLFLPLLTLGYAFFVYLKYGKEYPVVEPVAFYPPAGMNSAEVGFAYKLKCESNDVMTLLIYLADKGYVKITDQTNGRYNKQSSIFITKLREYDGDNKLERMFMEGLFKKGDTVTVSDLQYKFYTTVQKINTSISSKTNTAKIKEPIPGWRVFFIILATIVSFILLVFRPINECFGFDDGSIAIIFPAIALLITLVSCLMNGGKAMLFIYAWSFFFGGVIACIQIPQAYIYSPFYLPYGITGFVCIILIHFCLRALPRRTPLGNKLYGEIKGFRRFLQYAEKPKLEELVNENPSYFYDVLPYTYVLGVSNKWIKKFETIVQSPPDWYEGAGSYMAFSTFMSSTMNSSMRSMSSSPSSGGGGGGGGGFSGGGGGGGGGSSW